MPAKKGAAKRAIDAADAAAPIQLKNALVLASWSGVEEFWVMLVAPPLYKTTTKT